MSFLHNDIFAVVSENVQLNSALEKARGEIRVRADKSSYLFSIILQLTLSPASEGQALGAADDLS